MRWGALPKYAVFGQKDCGKKGVEMEHTCVVDFVLEENSGHTVFDEAWRVVRTVRRHVEVLIEAASLYRKHKIASTI